MSCDTKAQGVEIMALRAGFICSTYLYPGGLGGGFLAFCCGLDMSQDVSNPFIYPKINVCNESSWPKS
jgi:hypothetical protein